MTNPKYSAEGMAETAARARKQFRFVFVFPPFHFQNSSQRMKNEHVIVMTLCNISLAQGTDSKETGDDP